MDHTQTEKINPINRASGALRELQPRSIPAAPGNGNRTNTTYKTAYWVFTLLFALPLLASGTGFSIPAPFAVAGMAHLGFPVYMTRFLGVAKLFGAIAVLTGFSQRIKEWAYAGLVFNLIGASYCHLCSGDGPKTLPALVVLVFGVTSYYYWRKREAVRAIKNASA